MADKNDNVVALKAPPSRPKYERPFVSTYVARQLTRWIEDAHDECGITVVSGPWGIGKTTTLDAFAAREEVQCAIVKVEAGSRRGATPIVVMQLVLEAMTELLGQHRGQSPGNAYWVVRRRLFQMLEEYQRRTWDSEDSGRFTLIFDEAQYLSSESIEMLRFWNDADRSIMPFPIGLVFVGNNEFALQDDGTGQSVLSGAVRSRALFVEQLEYTDLTDEDMAAFAKSRGIVEPEAVAAFVGHFSSPRARRDLRLVERAIARMHDRAGDATISAEIVRSAINP